MALQGPKRALRDIIVQQDQKTVVDCCHRNTDPPPAPSPTYVVSPLNWKTVVSNSSEVQHVEYCLTCGMYVVFSLFPSCEKCTTTRTSSAESHKRMEKMKLTYRVGTLCTHCNCMRVV